MANSIDSLDLTKVPFGRTRSRFLVFEENNQDREDRRAGSGKPQPKEYPVQPPNHNDEDFPHGLYFAMCPQGGNAPRRKGIVDIVPVYDGKPLEYTYKATPSELRLETDKGFLRIVIDTKTTMRIMGSGVGMRLYVKLPFLSMMLGQMLPSGVAELNLSGPVATGGTFFFKMLKGNVTVDSRFDPLLNGPEYIHAEFTTDENGEFETSAYSRSPDDWGYIDCEPIDKCVEAVIDEFRGFLAKFPVTDEKWRRTKELSAYAMWIHYQAKSSLPVLPALKSDMIYFDMMRESQARAYEQPLYAMAFEDPLSSLELIRNNFSHMQNGMLPTAMSDSRPYFAAFPPTFGIAALHMLKNAGGKLSKDELLSLYKPMAEHYEWWIKSHSLADGRVSYNARTEYGFTGASYGTLSFPLEAPDLYAYMILYTEALAKLSELIGDGKSGQWEAASQKLLDTLLTLWDGEQFNCRGAISGETLKSQSLLTCLPIMLGKRLSDDIITGLTAMLGNTDTYLSERGLRTESKASAYYDAGAEGRGAVDAALQMLVIGGLFDAGAEDLAARAATALLTTMDEFGTRDSISAEGANVTRRPGAETGAIGGAAFVYLANKLHTCGKGR